MQILCKQIENFQREPLLDYQQNTRIYSSNSGIVALYFYPIFFYQSRKYYKRTKDNKQLPIANTFEVFEFES